MNIEVAGDGGSTTSEGTWYKIRTNFRFRPIPPTSSTRAGRSARSSSSAASSPTVTCRARNRRPTTGKHLHVAGLPRHIGRFHLHLPPRTFSDQDQPLADRPERRICRKRQSPQNEWDDKPGWQAYGLSNANKTSKYEGGSSIQIDFDRTFGRKGIFRYRTTLFSFIGWLSNLNMKNRYTSVSAYEKALQTWSDAQGVGDKPMLQIHPTVRWENTIDIKATKYLTTTFNFQLYYNRAQTTTSRPSCC